MSEVESTTDQTESNEPLWQVQLASGQVCRMTLELLDDAFQDGLISEDTLIMQDGTSEWVTLRQVAGLDSEGESDSPASDTAVNVAAPVVDGAAQEAAPGENPPAAQPVAAAAMVAPAPVAVPQQAPVAAQPAEPRPFMDPFAPPIQAAPAAPKPYMDPFAPPVQAPVAQMVPPGSAQAAPFAFQGAVGGQLSYAPPPEPLTRSTAPVAADVDFDLETVNFGKKRSPAKWIIGIAAVLGGVGFAAMNMNSTTEAIPPAVAAPAAPPAYETPPPAAQPAPAAPVVAAKASLSDDAKKALLDADKTRAAKMQQQRAAQPSRGGAAPSRGKKSDPFHKGGDKYDPLNASL